MNYVIVSQTLYLINSTQRRKTMYGHVQPLIKYQNNDYFDTLYQETRTLLFNLLDSPVKYTQHIGCLLYTSDAADE